MCVVVRSLLSSIPILVMMVNSNSGLATRAAHIIPIMTQLHSELTIIARAGVGTFRVFLQRLLRAAALPCSPMVRGAPGSSKQLRSECDVLRVLKSSPGETCWHIRLVRGRKTGRAALTTGGCSEKHLTYVSIIIIKNLIIGELGNSVIGGYSSDLRST